MQCSYIHTEKQTYTHTNTLTCMHTHTYIYKCVQTSLSLSLSLSILLLLSLAPRHRQTDAHKHTHIHTHIYIYIYIYQTQEDTHIYWSNGKANQLYTKPDYFWAGYCLHFRRQFSASCNFPSNSCVWLFFFLLLITFHFLIQFGSAEKFRPII